jgi:hypothetical protein
MQMVRSAPIPANMSLCAETLEHEFEIVFRKRECERSGMLDVRLERLSRLCTHIYNKYMENSASK